MSSNDPTAPIEIGGKPKKTNTAAIIVVVVLICVFVVPLIIGAIIVFAILGFISDHMGDLDLGEVIKGVESLQTDGVPLTHNESVAVRNLVSQLENTTIESYTLSRRDCRYLERIASYYVNDDNSTVGVSLCGGDYIYASAAYSAKDSSSSEKYNATSIYKISVANDVTCAIYTINGTLNTHNGLQVDKSLCNTENMKKYQLIETGEELEPDSYYKLKDDTEPKGEKNRA